MSWNRRSRWFLAVVWVSASLACHAESPRAPEEANTWVFVHGAHGNGSAFKSLETFLRAEGAIVYRQSLTGHGERSHLASPKITLTTHIDDVVNLIEAEDLHDVILVGHSYGGVVLTGVMNRIPSRLRLVVFLDAEIPNDGESLLDIDRQLGAAERKIVDGFIVPDWVPAGSPIPRGALQSSGTWTEPVAFNNPNARHLPVVFIMFLDPGTTLEQSMIGSGEIPAWSRLVVKRVAERGWDLRTMEGDHMAPVKRPKELATLLQKVLAERAYHGGPDAAR